MKITVTDRHIAAGSRCSPTGCMIALAIHDALRDAYWVSASQFDVRLQRRFRGRVETYTLPLVARVQVCMFDDGNRIEPFSFELPIEEPEAALTA